jgi:hypothetical protein
MPKYNELRVANPVFIKVFVQNTSDKIITDTCLASSYLKLGAKEKIDDFL